MNDRCWLWIQPVATYFQRPKRVDVSDRSWPKAGASRDGINDAGRTRVERNATLARNLEAYDIRAQQDIVPNTAHAGIAVVPYVQDFLLQPDD
jgi:hypothetical protein